MGIEPVFSEQQGRTALSADRIAVLDYARIFAAIMVLAFHWTFNGIYRGRVTSIQLVEPLAAVTKFGLLGVDLFFLISGYVIFYSARQRTAAQFATARAVRLYPMFWMAMTLTAAVCNLYGSPVYHVSFPTFLANLTMLAPVFGYRHVDWVYWTLVLELSFYALVLVILLLRLGNRLGQAMALWPFVMLGASAAGFGQLPLLGGHYFLFAAGALFAYYRETKKRWLVIPLCLCLMMTLWRITHRWPPFVEGDINVSCIVAAGLIVTFFALFMALNTDAVRKVKLPFSRVLGAISYPTYLLHGLIGYIIIQRIATDANKLAVWSGLLAAALLVSWGLHYAIEERLRPFWRWLGDKTVGRFVEYLQAAVSFGAARIRRQAHFGDS